MENEYKCATHPHELLMMNLSFFHLLLPLAALATGYIAPILSLALIASIGTLLWIAKKAKIHCCTASKDTPLVKAHWKKAWDRSKLLFIGYAISVSILGLGWFFATSQSDPNMEDILLVVFSWIAIIPLVFIVFALFVFSTVSSARAKRGEFPKVKGNIT